MVRKNKKDQENEQNQQDQYNSFLEALTDINDPENIINNNSSSNNSNNNSSNDDSDNKTNINISVFNNDSSSSTNNNEELSTEFLEKVLGDVAKIYNHSKTFLTLNEEKENLSKQIDKYKDLIKEKDKTIAESKKSIVALKLDNLSLINKNNNLNSKIFVKDAINNESTKEKNDLQNLYSLAKYDNLKEELLTQTAINERLTRANNNLKKRNSELQSQYDRNVINNNKKVILLNQQIKARDKNIDDLKQLLSTTAPSSSSTGMSCMFKNQRSTQFSQDLSGLEVKIENYITNLKTTTVELDYNNIDDLLIKYDYVTGAKETKRNQPLVNALLQRAVFDKLIELLKGFGDETNDCRSQGGCEFELYKLTNKLRDSSFGSDSYDLRNKLYNKATNLIKSRNKNNTSLTTFFDHISSSPQPSSLIREKAFDLLYTIGYNDNNNNKEHGFITFNKRLLDQHISQYRKITNQQEQIELDKLLGEIIRDFVKIFHFTHLEDLDDLEICWVLNGSVINPGFMEGQLNYNNVDNHVVEICRFPLIRSSKKVYSLAKVFTDKLGNSNTTIKPTTFEVIKWKADNN